MSHQNDSNLDRFKDNDTDASQQNNDKIDKCKVNDDKLNEKCEHNERNKKKSKSLKLYEGKEIK